MPPTVVVKKIQITQKRQLLSNGEFKSFLIESQIIIDETTGFSIEKFSKPWILIGLVLVVFASIVMTLLFTRHEDAITSICAVFNVSIAIISLGNSKL
jgi:hypothetical protein